MAPPPTPTLPESFFLPVLALKCRHSKVRWYMCVIINLTSLNYADVIPQVYTHLDRHLLSELDHDERYTCIHHIREGLTKGFGIHGPARGGNGIRIFGECTPEELKLKYSPRSQETEETAIKRGNEFFGKVYDRNPLYDVRDTEQASPDYLFVIKDIVYGRLFSYDKIIDDMTSSYAMVSSLYGMNSPGQIKNHLTGMLLNGADRDELVEHQKLCLGLAKFLNVTLRYDTPEVPTSPLQK